MFKCLNFDWSSTKGVWLFMMLFLMLSCGNCVVANGQESYQSPSEGLAGAVYGEILGSISLGSIHGEIGFDNPFREAAIQSIRLSIGAGIGWSGIFVPTRIKVFVGGEHPLELGCGVLLQPVKGTTTGGWYDWSDAQFSPNALIGLGMNHLITVYSSDSRLISL